MADLKGAYEKAISHSEYKGKSTEVGGGGRFAAMKDSLKGKVDNPGAVAAAIGRKKYGAEKMAKMSAAGRKK